MSLRFPLSALIYPRQCVDQAIAAYGHLCLIDIADETPNGCSIEIHPGPDSKKTEDRLALEFLNYLLDTSIEYHLGGSLPHEN